MKLQKGLKVKVLQKVLPGVSPAPSADRARSAAQAMARHCRTVRRKLPFQNFVFMCSPLLCKRVCLSGQKKNRPRSIPQPVRMRSDDFIFLFWSSSLFPSAPCGQPERRPSAWQLPFPLCCWWKRQTSQTRRGRGQ